MACNMFTQNKPTVQLAITLCLLCCVALPKGVQCRVLAVNNDISNSTAVHFNHELLMGKKDNSFQKMTSHSEWHCTNDSSCPPWFYCSTDSNNSCKCGKEYKHIISCNSETLTSSVLDCYCVTTNEQGNTFLGACLYNCATKGKSMLNAVYKPLPNTTQDLLNFCGSFGRTGTLCGQCETNLSLLVYSFDLKCVECPDGRKNWWKYIFAAYVPLTFFYLIVLFFKINANSSYLNGFVFYSQVVSLPVCCRILLKSVADIPLVAKLVRVLLALYGFWNLDFFRTLLPETICLQTNTLQTLALDYGIAMYPLVLIIISYVMIELHDRNFRIVVCIWRPFRFIFTFFRRNWDSRTSVIDAYATFFLLAYVKFLSVTFDLLTPTRLYELNSNKTTFVLYYDGSIEYFGKEHLPYAILALTVLLLFIFLPTAVLFLYPFCWFQKFLNCFPIRWHILHTFVDSFHGCYKDGTEPGTRDCRWFAAVFLLIRILGFFLFTGTGGTGNLEFSILTMLFLLLLLVTVQPFKEEVAHYTKINEAFVILVILLIGSMIGYDVAFSREQWLISSFLSLCGIFGVIPLLYISCIGIHWLVSRRKWSKEFIQRVRAWRQGYNWWELEEDLENSLPDRIVNPGQYHEGNLSNFSIQSSGVNVGHSVKSVSTD